MSSDKKLTGSTRTKFTKNCLAPWRSLEFLADGKVSPCCGPIRGDFGNLLEDLPTLDEEGGLFRNDAYRDLRRRLLDGDLPEACRNCRAVHDPDIPVEAFERKVVDYLEARGVTTEGKDLADLYAFEECGGNITNRCNFACIYCSHSGAGAKLGSLGKVMARESFMAILDCLIERGLRIFNFCGLGELTAYRHWQSLCRDILDRHPDLKLRLISNFGRRLSHDDLALLARFELIQISCDTFDTARFDWLRGKEKLPVLLENLKALRAILETRAPPRPTLAFNVTVSNANVDDMIGIFRYAAEHTMHVHLSALFDMEGSIAKETGCVRKIWEVSGHALLHNREVFLDLPRRLKAANPLASVWEYRHLHDELMRRADLVSLNQFLPEAHERFYSAFFAAPQIAGTAYLRKVWLDFDEAIRGIWIEPGVKFIVTLPFDSASLRYRVHLVQTKIDGSLILDEGNTVMANVGKTLTVSTNGNTGAHFLFEVTDYSRSECACPANKIVVDVRDANGPRRCVREATDSSALERIAEHFADSQQPLILWCAGLKTLQALSDTRLLQANIAMIIDGAPDKQGKTLCGHTIRPPEAARDLVCPILVLHASAPEAVEQELRRAGYRNEILIP